MAHLTQAQLISLNSGLSTCLIAFIASLAHLSYLANPLLLIKLSGIVDDTAGIAQFPELDLKNQHKEFRRDKQGNPQKP